MRFQHLLPLLALLAVSCNRSPSTYVEIGNKLFKAGKFDDAALNYRKAIQKDSKFGEAFYRLGLTEIEQNKLAEAYRSLSTASSLLPKNEDVRIKLGDLCLVAYVSDPKRPRVRYDQLNQIADELMALNPRSFDGFRLKAQIALSDRKIGEAISLFRRADEIRPMQPEVIHPLVQTLIQDKQLAEAEKLALALVERHKDYEQIYNILYVLYAATSRPAEAESILLTKVRNNPANVTAALELVNHYINVKKPSEIAPVLQRLLDNPKEFPDAPLRIGDFYADKGNYDAALGYYEIGAKQSDAKQRTIYRKKTTLVYIAQGRRAEAEKAANDLLEEDPSDDDSRNMRAVLRLESGNPGQLSAALRDLEDLVRRKPDEVNYHYNLGRAYYASGNLEAAQKQMFETLRRRPGYTPARQHLMDISLRKGEYVRAMQYVDEFLAVDPSNVRSRLVRAVCLIGLKNYSQARTELNRVLREQPGLTDAELQLGLLNIAEKKYGEADQIFRKHYRPGQPDLRPLRGLVESHVSRNQFDQAVELLSDELKRSPQSDQVRMTLAGMYRQTGRLEAALQLYQQMSSENPKASDLQIRVGQVYEAKGDLNAAIAAYRRAKALDPDNPAPSGYLARALDVLGRKDEAVSNYRAALRIQPENPAIQNNLAYALAETGKDLDEALKFAQQAQQTLPNDLGIQDTIGLIYLKKGLTDSALQMFSKLVRSEPRNAMFRYHHAMALLQKGDKQNARVALKNALANQPSKAEAVQITDLLGRVGNH